MSVDSDGQAKEMGEVTTETTPETDENDSRPTRDPPADIGAVLDGKYKLVRLIGEGGMGAVYEARHLLIERRLAIKILFPDVAKKASNVARFHNEARIATALGHKNIIEVTDMGTLPNGAPYIVMEFLEGQSLAQHIASQGRLPVAEAVGIIGWVLSVLEVVHRAGVVHRDLKPDNIFLAHDASDGQTVVKLLDFGISKVRSSTLQSLELTKTGAILGTPYYMAPEQALGKKQVDHRVDVFAAGVILYEALTGRRPFEADNYNALMVAIASQDPTPLRDHRPDLAPELEAAVLEALVREPEERFQSSGEFLAALKPFMEKDLAAALSPILGLEDTDQRVLTPRTPARAGKAPRSRPPRTGRWIGLVLASVILLGGIVAIAFAWVGGSPTVEAVSSLDASEPRIDEQQPQVKIEPAPPVAADAGVTSTKTDRSGPDAGDARMVKLTVQVEPRSARLRIDGVEVVGNPYVGTYPRRSRHLLEASAEGFRPDTRWVTSEDDRTEQINLRKAPPANKIPGAWDIELDDNDPYDR